MSAPTRDRLRFDRSDQIGTTVLVWATVLACAVRPVVLVYLWLTSRRSIVRDVRLTVPDDAAGVGRVLHPVESSVMLDHVPGAGFALLLSTHLLSLGLVIWGAVLVSRILADLVHGDLFTRANVTRLRVLAVMAAAGPLLTSMGESFARQQVLWMVGRERLSWETELSLTTLLAALVLAAIAQAVAQGARLRQDVEGLV